MSKGSIVKSPTHLKVWWKQYWYFKQSSIACSNTQVSTAYLNSNNGLCFHHKRNSHLNMEVFTSARAVHEEENLQCPTLVINIVRMIRLAFQKQIVKKLIHHFHLSPTVLFDKSLHKLYCKFLNRRRVRNCITPKNYYLPTFLVVLAKTNIRAI